MEERGERNSGDFRFSEVESNGNDEGDCAGEIVKIVDEDELEGTSTA